MSQDAASSSSETKQETVTLTNSVDETTQPERVNQLVAEAQQFMGSAPSGSMIGCDGRVYVPTENYLHIPSPNDVTPDGGFVSPYIEPYKPYAPPWTPDDGNSSSSFTWTGTTLFTVPGLSLYLVPKNVISYVDALDSIEGMAAMGGLRRVQMFWKGEDCDDNNGLLLERDIGSEPPVRVNTVSSGLFSTVKLGADTLCSIVGEVKINDLRLICVFGSIHVKSVESDFNMTQFAVPTEELELISPTALPWKDTESILSEVEEGM